jgi:hypothetical protein
MAERLLTRWKSVSRLTSGAGGRKGLSLLYRDRSHRARGCPLLLELHGRIEIGCGGRNRFARQYRFAIAQPAKPSTAVRCSVLCCSAAIPSNHRTRSSGISSPSRYTGHLSRRQTVGRATATTRWHYGAVSGGGRSAEALPRIFETPWRASDHRDSGGETLAKSH